MKAIPEHEGDEIPCSGADGTCSRPVKKAGLCWGHWKRKMRGRQPVSGELADYISDQEVFEGLFRVALEYADVAAEAEQAEVERVREKFKYAVWRYVRQWVAGRLKGQTRRVPLVGKSK